MSSPTPPSSPRRAFLRIFRVLLLLLASLYLFLLSLKLIQGGARDLLGLLNPSGREVTPAGAVGTGFIGSCIALSGSPVAAAALSFLEGGILGTLSSYSMIIGSRLGASFVVLVVGLLYDLQGRRAREGVYVGALALVTTATIYIPAFFIGFAILQAGWLDGLRLGFPARLVGILEALLQPVLAPLQAWLPSWAQGIAGVALLVGAFKLFDGFLPVVDPTGGRISRMATTVYRPWLTFFLGMLVTTVTLSVSVSLTLLVPLTARGIVRRENLIPYILGANITTFVDTIFASLFLKNHSGFTVVACAMGVVTALSFPVVFLAYRPYERMVDGLTRAATRSYSRLFGFVLLLFAAAVSLIIFQ